MVPTFFDVLRRYPHQSYSRRSFLSAFTLGLGLVSCLPHPSLGQIPACLLDELAVDSTLSLLHPSPHAALLQESWLAYRQRFIQADGRVIDREDQDRSTSEGQAYAMWRALLINDPDTFVRTLRWAEHNLTRKDEAGQPTDHLWAWHWGRNHQGQWTTLDRNFASDADIDAVTALLLAAQRWNCPDYRALARVKLNDLWELSTVLLPDGHRYLLPGPTEAFWNQPQQLVLNPSYLAPYAFRLFAQVDSHHDWNALLDSSYQALAQASQLSPVGLPPDWVSVNPQTGVYGPVQGYPNLYSRYSFDAYRVWWRVALDASWFSEPRAHQYLQDHLGFLQDRWRAQRSIPARLDLHGNPLVRYESTAQYAMLYVALQTLDPQMARQIFEQKLMPRYRDGFWDNNTAYYTQNLAWFALLPPLQPGDV